MQCIQGPHSRFFGRIGSHSSGHFGGALALPPPLLNTQNLGKDHALPALRLVGALAISYIPVQCTTSSHCIEPQSTLHHFLWSRQYIFTKKFEIYSQNLKNHGLLYATHSLTNFISKWRLRDRRGQTAPAIEAAEAVATSSEAAAVNNQEPLLSRLAGTGKDKLKRIRFRSN